jgi:transcription antitermination factor NusG
MEKWYVAHSKPRSEELLWKQFCMRNLETYYPCIKVQTVNPRARQVQPYFPSYLFVRVDLDLIGRSTLNWLPGGAGLVSFGDEPAFVPDNLVYAIKKQVENLNVISETSATPLCKGDNVVIHDGAFAGYEGVFDIQLSGTDRVRILLSLVNNRFIPVEIPVSRIHRLE